MPLQAMQLLRAVLCDGHTSLRLSCRSVKEEASPLREALAASCCNAAARRSGPAELSACGAPAQEQRHVMALAIPV